jgi:hypothetical protein
VRQYLGERDEPRIALRRALAQLPVDPGQAAYLHERLLDARLDPAFDDFSVIRNALQPPSAPLVAGLWGTLRDVERAADDRFRAGLALAKYDQTSQKAGVSDEPGFSNAGWTDADAAFLAGQLVTANPDYQRSLRAFLSPIGQRLLIPLEITFHDATARDTVREAAANALAEFAADEPDRLARLASEATPEQHRILYPVLTGTEARTEQATAKLLELAREQPSEAMVERQRVELGQRRAGAAITLVRMGERESAFDALRVQDDPESLTQFVHRHKARGVRPDQILECLERATEERVRFGLLLALGEFSLDEIAEARRQALADQLADWYRNDPSSAIHGACGWLLRNWAAQEKPVFFREAGFLRSQLDAVDHTPLPYDPAGKRDWFTLEIKTTDPGLLGFLGSKTHHDYMTFVVLQPGEYTLGSPDSELERNTDEKLRRVRITRPFAMLDREITVAQWQRFEKATEYGYSEEHSPTPQHPVNAPTWYTRQKADILRRAALRLEQIRYQFRMAKDLRIMALDSHRHAIGSASHRPPPDEAKLRKTGRSRARAWEREAVPELIGVGAERRSSRWARRLASEQSLLGPAWFGRAARRTRRR